MEESKVPTGYATNCRECGLVYMTKESYNYQMNRPDSFWQCARCGDGASWSDEVYEVYLDSQE